MVLRQRMILDDRLTIFLHGGTRRFLATIEPWHGNEAAIDQESGDTWQPHVIEDSLAKATPF